MACMGMNQPRETISARMDAIRRLEQMLTDGTVQAVISAAGAVAFRNWTQGRSDVSDVCAYRTLTAMNSPALRKAMARAEVSAGRKVDVRQISAGVHSHDGGKSWGAH